MNFYSLSFLKYRIMSASVAQRPFKVHYLIRSKTHNLINNIIFVSTRLYEI